MVANVLSIEQRDPKHYVFYPLFKDQFACPTIRGANFQRMRVVPTSNVEFDNSQTKMTDTWQAQTWMRKFKVGTVFDHWLPFKHLNRRLHRLAVLVLALTDEDVAFKKDKRGMIGMFWMVLRIENLCKKSTADFCQWPSLWYAHTLCIATVHPTLKSENHCTILSKSRFKTRRNSVAMQWPVASYQQAWPIE